MAGTRITVVLPLHGSATRSPSRLGREELEARLARIWGLASEAISARELQAFDAIMAHGMRVHHDFYFSEDEKWKENR